jgi:hypothetical protein
VSDYVRIGLGILAAAWAGPAIRWLVLSLVDAGVERPPALYTSFRTIPALELLVAVIASSWPIAVAAFVTWAALAIAVEIAKRVRPDLG